jgi:alkylation response protein AidB-like acyl-CoA dehydrogenase
MTQFKAPTDDILLALTAARTSGLPDWDDELAGEIIAHFASFAEGVIAPLDEVGDRQGCRLEGGRVRMPDGFREAYRQLAEAGWQGLGAPTEYGGQGMPSPVCAAVSEISTGANHSLQMVTSLAPGAVETLLAFGSRAQKDAYVPQLVSGEWLSTMALTESGAGSDLSQVRTTARRDGDLWRLDGEKIFISGGDQDLSNGILHLVLARTGPVDAGVKGLSLFVCLSDFNGARNGVTVERVEEKMGIHASPTCQLVFNDAKAELVGEEGQGLQAMFTMMNHARLDVALQGVAHAARAADISRRYAAERKQGRTTGGRPATIDMHGDVARMIDAQDMLALGGRVMCHMAFVEMEKGERPELVDFLTPVCKHFCTEAGIRAADLAIQVLGGYGYLREYRAEQNWRDARICAIYEGANGIHATNLVTRGLRFRNGALAKAFENFVEEEKATSSEAPIAGLLDTWREAAGIVSGISDPGAVAEEFMALTGEIVYAIAWARLAATSQDPRIQRLAAKAFGQALAAARASREMISVNKNRSCAPG